MKTVSMTAEAEALARELLRQHEIVCKTFVVKAAADVTDDMIMRSTVAYGMLCSRAGLPYLTRPVGNFLGEVADWCNANGWPPLNSLAVNEQTKIPGGGYDTASGCSLLHWPDEVRRCIAFRGYPPRP